MISTMDGDPDRQTRFWFKGRRSPRQIDWVLFGVAVILSAVWVTQVDVRPGWLWAAFVLLPFLTIPLLWRRSQPGAALALLSGAVAASIAVSEQAVRSGPRIACAAGMVIGAYSAAQYGGRRTRLVSGALAALAFVAVLSIAFVTHHEMLLWPIHTALIGFGVAWVVGDRVRTHKAYVAELEERALRLKRERDEEVRRAGELERMRIARELHDVVAHNVSVIAVQAGAARATAETSPERALETLGLIEHTARTTLAELRTVLGVLRRSPDADPAAACHRPQPTLRELDELVGQARDAGVDVEANVEGVPRPLPAIVDLSAYRVIQEALTNIMKHAADTHAQVRVRYETDELVLSITNDGPEPTGEESEGHGLVGMKERVVLAGGQLKVGPLVGGGFGVEARLPLGSGQDGGFADAATSPDSALASAYPGDTR